MNETQATDIINEELNPYYMTMAAGDQCNPQGLDFNYSEGVLQISPVYLEAIAHLMGYKITPINPPQPEDDL